MGRNSWEMDYVNFSDPLLTTVCSTQGLSYTASLGERAKFFTRFVFFITLGHEVKLAILHALYLDTKPLEGRSWRCQKLNYCALRTTRIFDVSGAVWRALKYSVSCVSVTSWSVAYFVTLEVITNEKWSRTILWRAFHKEKGRPSGLRHVACFGRLLESWDGRMHLSITKTVDRCTFAERLSQTFHHQNVYWKTHEAYGQHSVGYGLAVEWRSGRSPPISFGETRSRISKGETARRSLIFEAGFCFEAWQNVTRFRQHVSRTWNSYFERKW